MTIEKWTYAGRESDWIGKTVQARYLRPDGAFAFFDVTPKTRESHRKVIGGIYDVEIIENEGGRAYKLAAAKLLGRESDRDKIAAWQASDATAQATANAARDVEKKKDDVLEEAMARLRSAYDKLSPIQRPAFELWVLRGLRR